MSDRRPVLLLAGGLVTAWNQRFIAAALARGLDLLILDEPSPRAERLLTGCAEPEHPLRPIADAFLVHPASLTEAVDRVARWRTEYDIRGACCLREEFVETTSVVCDLLGLPHPGLRAGRVCRNKYLQRQYLAQWSPGSTVVVPARRQPIAAGWDEFPLIVKPVGRLASSGVRQVADKPTLARCLADYGADEVLLFECRVAGPEYSVESLSAGGRVLYLEVTEKRTTEVASDFFVELGHTTPAPRLHAAARARLAATHRAILERLEMDTGMAHAEYRIGADGRPWVIEIAVRPPGDSIMALHWLATACPLEDAVVGLAVGEQPVIASAHRFARQVYLPHEPGVFEGMDLDPALSVPARWFDPAHVEVQVGSCSSPGEPPTVRCVYGLKPPGTVLGPLRQSSDRTAMFVVDADTPEQLDEVERRCRAAVRLRIGS